MFEPCKVTTAHVNEFLSYLRKERKYESAYVNKILASLKTFYKYAIETKCCPFNPMLKIKMKRTLKQYAAPVWLKAQELSKFYLSIQEEKNDKKRARDLSICRIMADAGLTVQEVSDLNVDDVCFEDQKESIVIRNGKSGKTRIVPLNIDTIESLNIWLKFHTTTNNINKAMFISERNTRLSDRTIRYMVTGYAELAGLKDVSPHTLRHTFCKNLFDQGISLAQIAYLAGHNSLETTRRYTH